MVKATNSADGLLFSPALLEEYLRVLRKPAAVERHRLGDGDIRTLIGGLQSLGVGAAPLAGPPCPDPRDQHLWNLLSFDPQSILVTGERVLLASEDFPGRVLSPRQFVEQF